MQYVVNLTESLPEIRSSVDLLLTHYFGSRSVALGDSLRPNAECPHTSATLNTTPARADWVQYNNLRAKRLKVQISKIEHLLRLEAQTSLRQWWSATMQSSLNPRPLLERGYELAVDYAITLVRSKLQPKRAPQPFKALIPSESVATPLSHVLFPETAGPYSIYLSPAQLAPGDSPDHEPNTSLPSERRLVQSKINQLVNMLKDPSNTKVARAVGYFTQRYQNRPNRNTQVHA